MTEDLSIQALRFLRGSKTSEAMSPELREALYSPVLFSDETRLDEVLVDAILGGRDIVISGTAGGGKTMLVDQVVRLLSERDSEVVVVDEWDGPIAGIAGVLVIRDLTAVGPERFLDVFSRDSRPPLLLAANEGALMDPRLGGCLASVIHDLHQMQQGHLLPDGLGPVVIDMAAIDPINQALPSLLGNELLHSAVRLAVSSGGGAPDSSRLMALRHLENSRRIRKICELTRMALGPGEVTFRELWNFLADLLLGGDDACVPPTSTWFWRYFYGESTIAGELRSVLRPENLSLPTQSLKLYRGDFNGLDMGDQSKLEWVHPGEDPNRALGEVKTDLMRWVRLQYLILRIGEPNYVSPRLLGEFSLLYSGLALESRGALQIAQAINNYFRGQHSESAQFNGLELWVDLMVERRTDRRYLVSLGRIPSISLSIGTSIATGRIENRVLNGCRIFLHAGDVENRASLELSVDLFSALFRGRSTRTFERENDEIDVAIRGFFLSASISTRLEQSDVLRVLALGSDEGSREISWRIADRLQLQDV